MKIPFWQPSREYAKYKEEIDEAMQSCLEKGSLMIGFGDEIETFEKSFAEFVGAKRCVMVGSGSHAIYCSLKALGIGLGDEVITTPHTFVATVNQIAEAGATPILVDTDRHGLIDPILVERAITPRTKAIMPVHIEGMICNMDELMHIAERYQLRIVEDACQAVGAKWKGDNAGTIGDVGCHSFHPAKILGSVGNAGAIVTNDDQLADEVAMWRIHHGLGKHLVDLPENVTPKLSGNYKPDNIQAAVLNIKMKYLQERIDRRQEVADMYYEGLGDIGLKLPYRQEGRVYQDFVIRCGRSAERDKLIAHLKEKGIGVLGHDLYPIQKYPELNLHFDCPLADEYVFTQVRIPCSPDHSDEEIRYVIDSIKEFYV